MGLRLATFNVENLDEPRRGQPSLEARIGALRPAIVALGADVLCLQEVSARSSRQRTLHELRALDRLVEGTPYARFDRASTRGSSGGPADKHNLVVLSRLPIVSEAQHWHDRVAPPVVELSIARARDSEFVVRWDRPVLEVQLRCPDGRRLVVFNAHLRAPLAAAIEGQKLSPFAWRSVEAWAEGYYVASLKRAAQALELRKHVDRALDEDADALVLVAGDLNADMTGTALRILRADVEDTGNPALEGRSLVPLEDSVPEARRYTVVHRGRRQLLDHLLASRALAGRRRATSIHNEGLIDEYEVTVGTVEPLGSLHAPIVAEIDLPS